MPLLPDTPHCEHSGALAERSCGTSGGLSTRLQTDFDLSSAGSSRDRTHGTV